MSSCWTLFQFVSCVAFAWIASVKAQSTEFNISSDVPQSGIDLIEYTSGVFYFNISAFALNQEYLFSLHSDDDVIVTASDVTLRSADCVTLPEGNTTCYWSSNSTVTGHRLGRATLTPLILAPAIDAQNLSRRINDGQFTNGMPIDDVTYPVTVIRPHGAVDIAFKVIVMLSVVINFIGFGCKFDRDEAKDLFHRPFPVVLGSALLYTMMPLLSFALTSAVGASGIYKLGLLATGCSPSGGFSNVATLLMNGDVTLSLCLTITNGIVAFAMMPLWLLTLGQSFLDDNISIPFLDVFQSLIMVIIPLIIGMLIRHFLPKLAKKFVRVLKPVTLLLTFGSLGFGFYANLYALWLSVEDWRIPVSAVLLIYLGMLSAAGIAYFCRQSNERIITIACEVGLQNFGVAYVVLIQSLPQPEADLAAVMPLNSGLYQPGLLIPLGLYKCFIVLFRGLKHDFIRRRLDSQKDPAIESVADLHIGVIESVIVEDTQAKSSQRRGEEGPIHDVPVTHDYGSMYDEPHNDSDNDSPGCNRIGADRASSGPIHISRSMNGITNVVYSKGDDIDDPDGSPVAHKY